jgi:hypothetical protein
VGEPADISPDQSDGTAYVPQMPENLDSIPVSAPITDSGVSDSVVASSETSSDRAVTSTDTGNAAAPIPNKPESVAKKPEQAASAPQAQVSQGAAAITITQEGSSVSVSSSALQTNTSANSSSVTVSEKAEMSRSENISGSVSIPADSPANIGQPIIPGGEIMGVMPQVDKPAEGIGTMPQMALSHETARNLGNIPMFSNVEMGGGRITGTETSGKFPGGIEFGMYNAAQFNKPEGPHTTVKTADGAKWYKQYAAPSAEKTPLIAENGKIKYEENIVNKLPPAPRRKDRV